MARLMLRLCTRPGGIEEGLIGQCTAEASLLAEKDSWRGSDVQVTGGRLVVPEPAGRSTRPAGRTVYSMISCSNPLRRFTKATGLSS